VILPDSQGLQQEIAESELFISLVVYLWRTAYYDYRWLACRQSLACISFPPIEFIVLLTRADTFPANEMAIWTITFHQIIVIALCFYAVSSRAGRP
jgi:hypothetical protein